MNACSRNCGIWCSGLFFLISFTLLSKALCAADIAAWCGKNEAPAPIRVRAAQMGDVVVAAAVALTNSDSAGDKTAATFFTVNEKEKKWKK